MSRTIHSYDPAQGHGLPHDPFNAIVGPRPIGWIASRSAGGAVNLAPYSFFNAFNYKPPIVGFSSNGWKDTVGNIAEQGEFTWNLVTRPLAEAMNRTCAPVPHGTNEFTLAGLTELRSDRIAVPRVAESPVSFECRRTQTLRLKDVDGREIDTWMTFGEVVRVHIDAALLEEGVYQTAKAHPIVRGGGPGDYFAIEPENRFVMLRPT